MVIIYKIMNVIKVYLKIVQYIKMLIYVNYVIKDMN